MVAKLGCSNRSPTSKKKSAHSTFDIKWIENCVIHLIYLVVVYDINVVDGFTSTSFRTNGTTDKILQLQHRGTPSKYNIQSTHCTKRLATNIVLWHESNTYHTPCILVRATFIVRLGELERTEDRPVVIVAFLPLHCIYFVILVFIAQFTLR